MKVANYFNAECLKYMFLWVAGIYPEHERVLWTLIQTENVGEWAYLCKEGM
jgi:hypothetical protein